jgi:hypothetical protein
MTRDAFLLSPYRPPTSYPVTLTPDEAAAWLAGYFALWHPAVLKGLAKPPQIGSTYDHDQPTEGAVYAVPEGPHLYQPDDWMDRVKAANAVAFKPTADRKETHARMLAGFWDTPAGTAAGKLLDVSPDDARSFAGVGYGYLLVETLFDAADHEHLLDVAGFWADVSQAVVSLEAGDSAAVRTNLVAAVEKLRSAREVLNTTKIHLLDFAIPEKPDLEAGWPGSLNAGLPLTVLASAEVLERMAADFPERFAELKAKFVPDLPGSVDVACGAYREREDALFPAESQWWNLGKARSAVRALLGYEPAVYGRRRSALHPDIPGWAKHVGFGGAFVAALDGAMNPTRNAALVNWPGPDGKSIDGFAREPHPAADAATFFNLAYHVHKAMTGDSQPTVAFAHKGTAPAVGYDEFLALGELGDAVGEFTTVGRYLADHHYGDYLGTAGADDFFTDYLDDRVTNLHRPDAVSGFARHLRLRRRLDGALAVAALHRMLTPAGPDELAATKTLDDLEDAIETRGADTGAASPDELEAKLVAAESDWARRLGDRIQARSEPGKPGVLVLNPCAFTRRVALELDGFTGPVPLADPVKASEFVDGKARLVVEVPALGFAWVPRTPGTPPKARIKTAENTTVRNEFFEAELDPATGSLRAFRDTRTRINRFGMQVVYNPGSKARARSVKVTHAGPALGEVTAEGDVLDEHDVVLATFKHRLRAWVGRPALELSLEFDVKHAPTGYPWHSYYAARFAWRDERAALFRGVNGANVQTSYTRPVSPDYLEIRLAAERTFVFTGGLPFIQRHATRMADVVLIPEGEQARKFDLLIAADREFPMQTAAGWVAPSPVVVTDRGPPPVGSSGWLAHVDLPSLLMTSLRPHGDGRAVSARFIECAGFGGTADLRFAKDPTHAAGIDGEGTEQLTITLADGAIPLEFSANEAFRVKAEWA